MGQEVMPGTNLSSINWAGTLSGHASRPYV